MPSYFDKERLLKLVSVVKSTFYVVSKNFLIIYSLKYMVT